MTVGEKMVWAATYALHRTQGKAGDREHDMANRAAKEAWRAVVALRMGVDLTLVTPEGDGMWLEMIGATRSPDGRLRP